MMPCQVRCINVSARKLAFLRCRPYSTQLGCVISDGRFQENSNEVDPVDKLMQSLVPLSSGLTTLVEGGKQFVSTLGANIKPEHKDEEEILHKLKLIQTRIAELPQPKFYFEDVTRLEKEKANLENRVQLPACLVDIPANTNSLLEHITITRHMVQIHNYNADCILPVTNNLLPIGPTLMDGAMLDQVFGIDDDNSNITEDYCENDQDVIQSYDIAKIIEHSHEKRKLAQQQYQLYMDYIHAVCDELLSIKSAQETKCDENNMKQNNDMHQMSIVHSSLPVNSDNHLNNSVLKSGKSVEGGEQRPDPGKKDSKANIDQLRAVQDHMVEQLPQLLLRTHDYRVYSPDMIFENNMWGKHYTTVGVSKYAVEIAKFRLWVHFKFANVKMLIVKAGCEEEQGQVKVQWRLSGLPQKQAFMFWKFIPGLYSKNLKKESETFEAISTFDVNGEGIITRHAIDRMIGDDEKAKVIKPNIAMKLAAALRPKPVMGSGGTACK